MNQIISNLFPSLDFPSIRAYVQHSLPLPAVIIYSIPEGLWILFVTQLSKEMIWNYPKRPFRLTFLPLIIACFIEGLQYFQLTDGTFDPMDLIVGFLAWLIALFILPPRIEQIKFSSASNKTVLLLTSYLIVLLSDVFY